MTDKNIVDSFLASDTSAEIEKIEDEILAPLLDELGRIEDYKIRYFTRAMLLRASDFWVAKSSHRHEFYPPDEMLEGGLVLHTKRVFRVVEIISAIYGLDTHESDKLKSAALIHDITKMNFNEHLDIEVYDYMHPYTIDAFYSAIKHDDELNSNHNQSNTLLLDDTTIEHILSAARSHKGVQSPIPETIPAKDSTKMLLHVANEIAKALHYFIDGEDVVLERWLTTNGEPA